MTREAFHEALERVELELLTLGELAGAAVRRAVDAVVDRDDALARAVIEGDDEIDVKFLQIDTDLLRCSPSSRPWPESFGSCRRSCIRRRISSGSATRR